MIAATQSSVSGQSLTFWPDAQVYSLTCLPLRIERAGVDVANDLRELAAIADCVRRFQDLGECQRCWIDRLCEEASTVLGRVADRVRDPLDARAIRLRGEVMLGRRSINEPDVVEMLYARPENELAVFCGDLKTWENKSERPYFSFFASVPIEEPTKRAALVVEGLDEIAKELARVLEQPRLAISPPALFTVHEIIACAGEANSFPKHFAYFLPEDEGHPDTPLAKTVVFSNLYRHRFEVTSRPLLDRIGPGLSPRCANGQELERALSLSMHAHDLGHGTVLGPVCLKCAEPTWDRFSNQVVDELIADLLEFSIMSTEAWQAITGVDRDAAVVHYVGEALRYAIRGKELFCDSGSAFMQLAYLLDHGMGGVHDSSFVLDVDVRRLQRGLLSLAREVLRGAAAGRCTLVPLLREFLFTGSAATTTLQLINTFRSRSAGVPHDTAYI